MTPRRQRLIGLSLVVVGVAVAAAVGAGAFRDSMMFYVELPDVVAGNFPAESDFRIGGLVTAGSVQRETGKLDVRFTLNDLEHSVDVVYAGILPDLFREGQGIIAHGRLNDDGVFEAHTVLAKHDENYMPPEVADALAKQGYKAEPKQ
ncbi:MAG: cytochrome c maturation protein CcmE [Pseudomonadota bacterium]